MKELLPDLKPGDFAENIITQGIDIDRLQVGDRILIGDDVVLEVSQVGKDCHTGCQIQKLTGKCIMPEKGVFTRVVRSGQINFLIHRS